MPDPRRYNDVRFGWTEQTEQTHIPATSEHTPDVRTGKTTLSKVDLHGEREDEYDGVVAPTEVRATAEWSDISPRLWTEGEKATQTNYSRTQNAQGTLLSPGKHSPATLTFLQSTKKSRFSAMSAIGTMANVVEGHGGGQLQADESLSKHSAPLVERITGQPQKVSNSVGFIDESVVADETQLPTTEGTQSYGKSRRVTETSRWIPDTEIQEGKARLVSTMRAQRAPRPSGDEQLSMFPDPGGPTLGDQVAFHTAQRAQSVLNIRRARRANPQNS